MRILALDPSSAYTGFSFYNDGIIESGFLRPLEGATEAQKYCDLFEQGFTLIEKTKPDLLLIEGYFFSSNFATGANMSVEIRGVLKLLAGNCRLNYLVIDPSQWKHALIDRAIPLLNPDKFKRCGTIESKAAKWRRLLKVEYGKLKAKKMITVLALDALGITCPKKIINPYTNCKLNFPFDVSDSLGILLSYLFREALAYNHNIIWQFTIAGEPVKPITKKETL